MRASGAFVQNENGIVDIIHKNLIINGIFFYVWFGAFQTFFETVSSFVTNQITATLFPSYKITF